MGGGVILSLVANERNIPDLYLTGDPQITHFKILFRRATPFSMQDSVINIKGNVRFGDEGYAPIRPHADMLHTLSLVVDIPTPKVEFKDPIYRTVRDIVIPCGLENIVDQIALANGDDLDDLVTYEKLFGPDITNPVGPLAEAMEELVEDTDVIYSKRLEVLNLFKTEYTQIDNRFGGRYVAIKPELIDFTQFEGTDSDPLGPSEKPVDPAGYLVMKADQTQYFYDQYILNPAFSFQFDCMDFLYDGRTREEYLAGESIDQNAGLQPEAIPVIEDLVRAYPRQIPNYRPIRTIADFEAFLAEPINHSMIISISQIDICRRVLLETARTDARLKSLNPLDLGKIDRENEVEIDECLFGNITINELIDYGFEFGVYSFEPDFDPDDFIVVPRGIRSTPDYDTCVADLFRRAKIRIPIVSVDRDVTVEVTQKFNRYCLNENATYNKTYDLRVPLRTPEVLEDVNGDPYLVDTEGYWMLDVSLIDRLEQANPDIDVGEGNIEDLAFASQDVLMVTPDEMNTDILINPFYLDARSDRLDWGTYIIKREWPEQMFKREVVDSNTGAIIPDDEVDPSDPNQVMIYSKPENIRDGLDILSDMVCEMYGIADVELASDIAKILNNDLFNVEDIEAYHKFLEANRKDMLNTENQVSSYRLNSASGCDGSNIYPEYDPDASNKQTLFNSRDIQEIMTGKLLRDVIYVDQERFSKNFANEFNLYFKLSFVSMGMLSNLMFWFSNPVYSFGGLIDLDDRETARDIIKYAMWSYHLENIEVQSRASGTGDQFPSRTQIIPTKPYDFYESETRYFNLFYPHAEKRYYVWFDTNGDGVTLDPGPLAGATSLPVDISALADPNDTAAVAQALATAIDANTDFSTAIDTNLVTATASDLGNSSDIADNNTGFTFAVTQQGSDLVPEISTIDTTTNVVLPANYYTTTVRLFDLYYYNPTRYYVWLDTIGDGVTNDPGPPAPGAMSIPVDISDIKIPDDKSIAVAIQEIIDAEADFIATICDNTILIKPSVDGDALDISDFNTDYAFNVIRQGDTGVMEEWAVDVTTLTTTLVSDAVNYLSKMLIQVPNVINMNGTITTDPLSYLKNVRYGKDDIDEITDSELYEDNSFIERFQTDVDVEPDKGYFEREQLLSGVRFNADDTINDQIEDLRDLVNSGASNPQFVDGRGTALNREVEFYHVIRTIDYNSSENLSKLVDSTIRDFFVAVIADSYVDSRAQDINYINTVSYAVTLKYLDEFFANTMVLTSELSVAEIGDVLLDICQNTVIRTLVNYNQYLFYIWRNSSYVDEELNPRVFIKNHSAIDSFTKLSVSFCQPGDKEFLDTCYPERLAEDPTLNPMLFRAKHLAGIDSRYRPRMGYGFTFDLDFDDPDTYRSEKSTVLEEREFTADTAGETSQIETPSVLGSSDFKDHYSEYIDNQVNDVKNEMKELINFGPSNQTELTTTDTLRENLVYTDWFDLQGFQTRAVNKVAEDREICSEELSYYTDAYVINHLPMTLAYYYGLYGQKMYSSIYPAIENGDTNLIENLDYMFVKSFDALSEDLSINALTDATTVALGNSVDSVLQFIGTDIREDAQCPIHGPISNLSDAQRDLYDRFLRDNATLGDTADPIYDECPLCFRTYAMNRLFNELVSTIFTSESKVSEDDVRTLRNEITDDEYIQLIIDGTADQIDRDGRFKNIFLYRPEMVYYDRVTETYFDTAIQYFLVRFATIQYRYARMVRHVVELSNVDYAAFIAGICINWTTTDIADFNTAYAFAVTQQGAACVPEISTVDTTTFVVLPANYYTDTDRWFDLYFLTSTRYYVWMDTNGDGVTDDPGPPAVGAISLPVDISAIADPNSTGAVALAIQTAIDLNENFTATIVGNVVTITTTTEIFDASAQDTYDAYIAHLDDLRTNGSGAAFESEYDLYNQAIMHNPSTGLVAILKNQVRPTESTTQYIDYTRGEETIYEYVPQRVIQNIVYDPTINILETYDSVRHLMYRGNVSVWYTIQRTIIDLYNDHLNNLSDPREIETTNDLFLESYNILQDRVPDQFTSLSSSNRRLIDFYRFKQIEEEGQLFEIPDFSSFPVPFPRNDLIGPSVDMITYSRELAIYYRMLVIRYEKRKFVIESIKNNALDDNTYYFEKTDAIAREFLEPIRKRIEEYEEAELVLDDVDDRECFYFNDTSNLYYLDGQDFRISVDREGDPEFVEDFREFDQLNNYHLSQGYTYNQIRNFYRLLGMAEQDELTVIGSFPPSLRVPEVFRDLDLIYTDEFERYRSLILTDPFLNNTSIYTQQSVDNSVFSIPYLHKSTEIPYPNRGLFYDIWSNYPTISSILYDLDYDPVAYNETDPMGDPGVFDRYLTGIKSSSPLNILKNRLEQFSFTDPTCGAFHTHELKEWEAEYICSKADPFDALRRVFNVYYFLTGACDYQDIYSMIGFARLEIAVGNKSLTARYQEFEAIADDIVKSLSRAFTITNDQLRIQNQLTTLLLLRNRHEPSVNAIKSKQIASFNCIRERIDLIADQFDFYMRSLSEAEITTVLDAIYDQLDAIDSAILSVTIDDILAGIEAGIIDGSISTVEELEALVDSNLDSLEAAVQMAIAVLNAELLIIQEQSCLKFTFIRSADSSLIQDARVHTPTRLFNLKELQFMNNFRNVEDVVRFLIAGVVAYMTPTTDRITPIYLDGIVTDAEKVIIDAEFAKTELNSRYGLPSIFDGGFNPLLADIIGDANPFRAGNYFSTSLCEAMNTQFPQIEDIYSETDSYQNMVDDLVRSIQLKLDIMAKLTVLERYKDLTRAPVCGFCYYDFDRFIQLDEVRDISLSKSKKYIEHKGDVRSHIIKKKRQESTALVGKNTKSIYQKKISDGLVDARQPYQKKKITDTNKTVRQAVQDEMNEMAGGMNIPLFFGSEVYERILKVLRITDAKPQHAWVRQLGIRMIEDLALVIDGEEIDGYNDELMLLLRQMMVDPEHDRGMDIMIGHIPEMYEISDRPRPAMRLYINTWFAFSRFPACSLPLVNMLYSNPLLRLKLRNIEELLYIEPGAELKKPVKIHANFMGRYIFLEEEERKRIATTKIQTMMERYRRVESIKTLSDITSSNVADGGKGRAMSNTTSGHTGNVTGSSARVERLIKQRYYFEDPTKFLLFRMRLIYPNPRPEDIIYWDIAAGSVGENERLGLTDERGKLLNKMKIFDRAKLRMNNVTRDNWRQEEYYRRLTTYNRNVRALNLNEGIYSFALYLKGMGPQPSGATNLTLIDNLTFLYEMSEDLVRALEAGARVRIAMFQCSHNIFVSASGFGALAFYGTHYS
jgi:Major capsid protein N-terminus